MEVIPRVASAAAEEQQLKVGKPSFKLPADGDIHYAGKIAGRGFSNKSMSWCAVTAQRFANAEHEGSRGTNLKDNKRASRTRDRIQPHALTTA